MSKLVRDDPGEFDTFAKRALAAAVHWRTILVLLGLTAAFAVSAAFAAESVADSLFGAGIGFSAALLVATVDNALSGGESR
jgi:hypothetical protein